MSSLDLINFILTTVQCEVVMHIAKYYRYIVKYDLKTRTKTEQLPAAFANVTDVVSSVDTAGKLSASAYH